MNKNRNKVAAMMMVAAITVSSVAMPVEAAVSSVESVGIESGNNVYEEGDIDLRKDIPDSRFREVIIEEARNKNIQISKDGIIKKEDIEKFKSFKYAENVDEQINLSGIEKFTGLEWLWIDYLGNSSLDLSNNTNLKMIRLRGNSCLEEINLSGIKTLETLEINTTNMKSLDLSTNTGLKQLQLLGDTSELKKGLGYLKLNENIKLDSYVPNEAQNTTVLVDNEKDKQIDLAKEFPGINPDDVILDPNQGVTKEGSIIKWDKVPKNPIRYTYRTQGKENGTLLYVRLYIEDSYGITEGVVINEKNFPDKEFRKYLCSSNFIAYDNGIDIQNFKEGDIIPAEVLRKIKNIDISGNKKIEDLTGIKYFKNLQMLNCNDNKIKNINVSENKELKGLDCNNNRLKTLDVSNNHNLIKLDCSSNLIYDLKISTDSSITSLNCNRNELSSIDTSNLKNLKNLGCGENNLKNLNLKELTKLESLYCASNDLESLDLLSLKNLKNLNCSSNKLSLLDLSENINLVSLGCSFNTKLNELDLSNNTKLTTLDCNNNNIEDIDLKNNNDLVSLYLTSNKLKSVKNLHLEKKENLEELRLEYNNISEDINLENNLKLEYLSVENNKNLKNINLSKNENLKKFSIRGTKIGKLELNEFVELDYPMIENEIYIDIDKNNKSIDLKEFNINKDDIVKGRFSLIYPEKGVKVNGTKLEWDDEIDKIYYTCNCGGKYDRCYMAVRLIINGDEEERPNPDKPINPDQGGGSGGGTTTPDQKPDQKPDEKPNKPVNISARIMGKNRYETAAKIADELVKNNVSYNSVILVNSDKSMADGLSAASLSGKKNAPILLVKKDSIPAEAMAKIEKAKNVYIIGGEGAISKKVENQLKGKNITRISGKDRYETSAKIASMLGGYKMAFIVNGAKGEADAMSVSSVSAKYGAPILLTNGKTSTHPVKEGVSYFVIGGRGVVSNQLADKYNADRIAGVDRYSTNRKVIDEFYYDSKKVYFAKGDTLVDALTASLLAKDNGMVLVSKNANHKKLEGKEAVQVGGMDFEISFE